MFNEIIFLPSTNPYPVIGSIWQYFLKKVLIKF